MTEGGDEPLRRVFGRRLRELRKLRGLTQRQLGSMSGMHPAYVGGLERGERNIALDGVERLARSLGISPAELMVHPALDSARTSLETRLRELSARAHDPGDLLLALEVASHLLDRLAERRRSAWMAAERRDS